MTVYFSINGPGSQQSVVVYDYVRMLIVDQVHRYSNLSPTANLNYLQLSFCFANSNVWCYILLVFSLCTSGKYEWVPPQEIHIYWHQGYNGILTSVFLVSKLSLLSVCLSVCDSCCMSSFFINMLLPVSASLNSAPLVCTVESILVQYGLRYT